MKKAILFLGATFLIQSYCSVAQQVRLCGEQIFNNALLASDPNWEQKFIDHRNSLQKIADDFTRYKSEYAAKTTAAARIPVIFHIIVDSAKFNELGGVAGIQQRCISQIAVLEEDFNARNADSSLIPLGFKPSFGSSGIHFGLAHVAPSGVWSPGFEIKIITSGGFSDASVSFASAKYDTAKGLNSWNVAKYLNIWCINFSGFSGLLGITTPKSKTGTGGRPLKEEGICIKYNAFGRRASASDSYPANFDLGRTLTHECGHFFEIYHIWGDDGGQCPWGGGVDDGIADTPPQSYETTGNPVYSVTDGTLWDGCKFDLSSTLMQPYGKACLNFMDYTDDKAMHMFSANQVAVMAAQVAPGGENDSLTIDPALTYDPINVTDVELSSSFNLYPNPSNGQINISFIETNNELMEITIVNTVGQLIERITFPNVKNGLFSINLPTISKGIYFVTCNFASGSISRKILIQ